jgi:allantoicase
VIIKLGTAGEIRRVEVDTSHFKGNFPESCSLEATKSEGADAESLSALSVVWRNVLPRTKLQAHTRHIFANELQNVGVVSHLRFNIFPDGGVSRLRIYGRPS